MPCFVDRFVDEHDRSVRRSPVRATRMESAGSNGRRDATRLLGEGGRTPRVALPVLGRRPHAAAQRGHTVLKLPPPFEHTPRLTRHEISRYDDRGPVWAWDCRTAAWRALAARRPVELILASEFDRRRAGPGAERH